MKRGAFADRVVARALAAPVDLGGFAEGTAAGSILNGASGVALFLVETARLRGEPKSLERARSWCRATRAWAATSTPAQWNDMPFGFFAGEAGLVFVEALVASEAKESAQVVVAVDRLAAIAARFADRTSDRALRAEVMGGAAGIAIAARALEARLGAEHEAPRASLATSRAAMIDLLLARFASPLAIGPEDYFGLAHGVAGELFAAVGEVGAAHPIARARLDELAALAQTDEEGLAYWPPWIGCEAIELFGSWCNGMAGHALLWTEVARRGGTDEDAARARASVESLEVLVNDAPSICCGHAGHALALRRYADVTGDDAIAALARARLDEAVAMSESDDAFVLGLWQGTLGVALAVMADEANEPGIVALGP